MNPLKADLGVYVRQESLKHGYVKKKKACHLVLHLYAIFLNNTGAYYAANVLRLKIATFELSSKNLPFIVGLPKLQIAPISQETKNALFRMCFLFLLLLISVWCEMKLCPTCGCFIPLRPFSVFGILEEQEESHVSCHSEWWKWNDLRHHRERYISPVPCICSQADHSLWLTCRKKAHGGPGLSIH